MNQMDKHLKVLLKGLTVGGGGGVFWGRGGGGGGALGGGGGGGGGEEKSQGTVHSQSVKMCNACTWLRVG